jgi:hypothetical protein
MNANNINDVLSTDWIREIQSYLYGKDWVTSNLVCKKWKRNDEDRKKKIAQYKTRPKINHAYRVEMLNYRYEQDMIAKYRSNLVLNFLNLLVGTAFGKRSKFNPSLCFPNGKIGKQ